MSEKLGGVGLPSVHVAVEEDGVFALKLVGLGEWEFCVGGKILVRR